MRRPRRDPLGNWFAQMRACGELPDIWIGRSVGASADAPVEWRRFPHEEFDGTGALATWLREAGYDLPALPAGKGEPRPASQVKRAKQWWRAVTRKLAVALDEVPPWRDFDPRVPPALTPPATTSLNAAETD